MNRMRFIGKSVYFEEQDERVLAIGDLHLGYSGAMRQTGILVPATIYEDTIRDLQQIFDSLQVSKTNKLTKLIILGDLKHAFGRILREEWREVSDFIQYATDFCEEIIIVKGNHDVILNSVLQKQTTHAVDYYVWNGIAFLHGDRDFPQLYDNTITTWVIGHAHPAITLDDGTKKEKYKCFLNGTYKKKEIVIAPSFLPVNEGTDVLSDYNLGLAWPFTLQKFTVHIVSEDTLDVLNFGTIKQLEN